MKVVKYRCDLCKNYYDPVEDQVNIRGKMRDICPACLNALEKRLDDVFPEMTEVQVTPKEPEAKEEPKAKEEPVVEKEKPKPAVVKTKEPAVQPKTKKKKKDEDAMKTRSLTRERFFELFDKGLENPEVTKRLNTGAANTCYWRKRWEEIHPEKKKDNKNE